MKSGILQKKTKSRNRFIRTYFVIGSLALMTLFIIYTNLVIKNIEKEVKIVPDLYSKILGLPSDVNMEHFLSQYFMDEIIPQIDTPIILVDSLKTPFSWEHIDIPKTEFSQLNEDDKLLLIKMMQKMEKNKSVIPLKFSKTDENIHSYVYYGDSITMKQVKRMPYFGLTLIVVFIFLGIYGVVIIKRGERDILWVGLAKETAHQFGTPLSSLSGWLNILKNKICDEEKNLHILDYMNSDVERLNKIASRFGKVGSDIKHQKLALHLIIAETIEYFKNRLPEKIDIHFHNEIENIEVNLDPDLIKWTLENLIKNALDAMKNSEGKILIKAFFQNGKVYIHIQDSGLGMPKSMFKKIFAPGTTSKQRGWGLGLSLAKRIIEEYHHGQIHVLESSDMGTTFEIILKGE